jgi:hypothetical protein
MHLVGGSFYCSHIDYFRQDGLKDASLESPFILAAKITTVFGGHSIEAIELGSLQRVSISCFYPPPGIETGSSTCTNTMDWTVRLAKWHSRKGERVRGREREAREGVGIEGWKDRDGRGALISGLSARNECWAPMHCVCPGRLWNVRGAVSGLLAALSTALGSSNPQSGHAMALTGLVTPTKNCNPPPQLPQSNRGAICAQWIGQDRCT